MTETPTRLTVEELNVIHYIEEHWVTKGTFPPVGAFNNLFPSFDLQVACKKPVFRLALDNRGIEIPHKILGEPSPLRENLSGLTDEQLAAITTLVNFEDKRSRDVKLRSLGIKPTKWAGWLKNPKFAAFLQEMSAVHFQDVVHIAHGGLLKAVDRGDTNAVKFYMEMTGRYNPSAGSSSTDMKLVVSRLIESIQMHVKDPLVLRAIAQDFDAILKGEPVVSQPQIELAI